MQTKYRKSKYRKSKNISRKIKKGGAFCEENLEKCDKKIQDLNIEINRLRDELNDIRNLKNTLAKELWDNHIQYLELRRLEDNNEGRTKESRG
jgi:hypothetical protein